MRAASCSQRSMASATPLFEGTRSIRLARLVLSPYGALCTVKLTTFALRDAPAYNALSYTWGSPFSNDNVLDNQVDELPERPAIISDFDHSDLGAQKPNLAGFLKAIVSYHSYLQHEWMWIDAVCIDQDNLAERASQVALMPLIYQRAAKVVVWLGPSDPDSYRALKVINAFHTVYELCNQKRIGVKDLTKYNTEPHFFKERYGVCDLDYGDWASVFRFFSRAWFFRRWAWPETTLARVIHVLCGKQGLSWQSLLDFETVYRVGRWGLTRSSIATAVSGISPVGALGPRVFMNEVVKDSQRFQQAVTHVHGTWADPSIIIELLSRSTKLEVSDPRDTIYAMFGLVAFVRNACESIHFEESYDNMMKQVDYHLTPKALFKFITVQYLKNIRGLSILSLVSNNIETASQEQDTWIPDLAKTDWFLISKGLGLDDTYDCAFSIPRGAAEKPARYFAPDERGHMSSPSKKSLRVYGYFLGIVGHWTTIDAFGYDFDSLYKLLFFCRLQPISKIWRAMIGDYMPRGSHDEMHPASDDLGLGFADFMLHIIAHYRIQSHFDSLSRQRIQSLCDVLMENRGRLLRSLEGPIVDYNLFQQVESPLNLDRSAMMASRKNVNHAYLILVDLQRGSLWRRTLEGTSPEALKTLMDITIDSDVLDAFWASLQQVGPRSIFELSVKSLHDDTDTLGIGPPIPPDAADLEVWGLEGGRVPLMLHKRSDRTFGLVQHCYLQHTLTMNVGSLWRHHIGLRRDARLEEITIV